MSKQVFKQKLGFVPSYKLERTGYRTSKVFSKKGKFVKRRTRLTLRKLYSWNARSFWKSAGYNKKQILKRVLRLGYYWYGRLHFKFNLIMLGLSLKSISQIDFPFNRVRNLASGNNYVDNSFSLNVSPYIYKSVYKKSCQRFVFSNMYSLSMQRIRYLSKLVSKFAMWRTYPTWLLRKYFRIFLFRKRRLKKILLARHVRRMFNFNTDSLYMSSYMSVISQLIYGKMLLLFRSVFALDLQKYSSKKVSFMFHFIGGNSITPNIILGYLLYKLVRLHLPTEMIPKLLYKFNGLTRKVSQRVYGSFKDLFKQFLLGKSPAFRRDNKFFQRGFVKGRKKNYTERYFMKYVRAYTPFFKGMLFKCNGRFTRKQMSAHLRFSKGVIPLATISNDIRYVFGTVSLKYGSLGVNIYFNYGVYSNILKEVRYSI